MWRHWNRSRSARPSTTHRAVLLIAGLVGAACAGGAAVGADEQPGKALGDAPALQAPAGADNADPMSGWGLNLGRIKPSEYWLGLLCYVPEPALRSQLKLPADRGLVVARLVPDSPAAKAGIQEHDVLLKAGDKTLGQIPDLIEAVDAVKDTKLSLELIRAGQTLSVEVQPQKRPANTEVAQPAEENDWKTLRGWMDRMVPGGPPMRFQFFHPGMILPPELPALPNDMSVTVTRQGSEPARIVVQQGEQRWEVSEKELDKLPPDVRQHVQRMLTPASPPSVLPDSSASPAAVLPGFGDRLERMESRLQKQLDKMNERFEQLRKEMEELRSRPKGTPAEKPSKL